MSQAPTNQNAIDIPLLGEDFEDLLIGVSPIVRGADFAMRDRPEVIGTDRRSTWTRFSDWIFDGVLPDSQPKYRGEGQSEEDRIEAQKAAALRQRGGKPFVDKDSGSAQRLAADLLVGFADEGKLPLETDPADQVADDILLDLSRATIADPNAPVEEKQEAVEVIGDRAVRMMSEKQKAEAGLAELSNGDDLAKRVVELYADGKSIDEIGADLREGGWDYSMADSKLMDRLGQEVEILLDQGEFAKAKSLTFARLNLMKHGSAPDVNATPYDALLDEFIKADTANMTRSEAFSIAGTDAFLSTIRGIGRLTGLGYTTPKDEDILEKMTAEAYGKHPIVSLGGSFAGGFVDPVFFGVSMGVAKAPITAAQKGRYAATLVARGMKTEVAEQIAKRATFETIAAERVTKYFLNRGMSLRGAQAVGNLVWNITDAAVTNAGAEGIIAAGEGVTPTEVAIRSLKGAGTGMVMGTVLDRAFAGIDKASRALMRNIPSDAAVKLDMGIDFASARGEEGTELAKQLRDLATRFKSMSDELGRKLTPDEVAEITASSGIDLDEMVSLRTQQKAEIKAKKAQPDKKAEDLGAGTESGGQKLSELEKEAIERGILKAPTKELSDSEKKAKSKEADKAQEERVVETERLVEEMRGLEDAELSKRYETAEGAELDAVDMVIAERMAEAKKSGDAAGPEDGGYPVKVSIDELSEIEAPSADLVDDSPEELKGSAMLQRRNLDEIDHRDDDWVKVRIPLEDIDRGNFRENLSSEAEVAQYSDMDPESMPPIAVGPPLAGDMDEGKIAILADGSRRFAAAELRGDTDIEAYVPEWFSKKNVLMPSHLMKITERMQAGANKKAASTIIDRTPEGFGPDQDGPDIAGKIGRDIDAEVLKELGLSDTKPVAMKLVHRFEADDYEIGMNGRGEGSSQYITVFDPKDADAESFEIRVSDHDPGRNFDANFDLRVSDDLDSVNKQLDQAFKEAKEFFDDTETATTRPDDTAEPDAGDGDAVVGDREAPGRDPGDTSGARTQDAEQSRAEAEEVADSAAREGYEEMPTEMSDMRIFMEATKDGEEVGGPARVPLSESERKVRLGKMKKKVADAEAIARAKPRKPTKKKAAGIGKPGVFKKAPSKNAFTRDMGKIIGEEPGRTGGFVQVDGGRADFIDGHMTTRIDASRWDTDWGKDGVYSVKGDKLVSSDAKKLEIDAYFDRSANGVFFDDLKAQDLVVFARKIKIMGGEPPTGVVFKNTDGSIGFSAKSPEVGTAMLSVNPGATPIGMVDSSILEKAARAMQRGGSETFTLEAKPQSGRGAPEINKTTMFVLHGDGVQVAMAGLNPVAASKRGAGPEIPKDPTSELSTRGPGGRKTTPDSETRPVEDAPGQMRLDEQETLIGEVTGHDLDTIKGMPGDQRDVIHNGSPNSGVDPGLTRKEPPDWVRKPAKTKRGKKVVGRIKSDQKGMKYGVRSIAEALAADLRILTRQTREQTTQKNPAHYAAQPHMVRTRSASEPNWMFHEHGHGISAVIRESNPRFLKDFETNLLEIANWRGSMASANSAEEGFAEFVRRMIVDPKRMEGWEPTKRIFGAIESANPKIADAIQDATRGFDAHMARPIEARWRSYQSDTKSKPATARNVLARAMVDFVSRGFAPEFATRKVMVEVRKEANSIRKGWKAVDSLESKIAGGVGDMKNAYQSLNHIGQMTNVALQGPGKVPAGKPTGMRVHATVVPESLIGSGFDRPRGSEDPKASAMFNPTERKMMVDAGFKVPDEPKMHGDVVVLANKSVADAIAPITKEDWPQFETYAQMKATVARIYARAKEGRAFPYQTQGEGVSPIALIQEVNAAEKKNPKWESVFADLEEIANATLVLSVMAGELDVSDAIKIKSAFEHYIPLTRQGESGPHGIGSGATAAPSANIRRSNGSVNPAEPLLIAMARKIDEAVNAYYWNRFAMSPILFAQQLRTMKDVPKSAKIASERVAVQLHLDTKKVAKASPEEVQKAIYDYIVERVNAGDQTFNLAPEELDSFTKDDIGIVDGFDLWRKVPPKAVNVLAPNVNGRRVYYQVLDDNLYRIFAEGGGNVAQIAQISEDLFGSRTDGQKLQITNTFTFVLRNLVRDSLTATMFGTDVKGLIPGYYHAVGALSKITGRDAGTLVDSDLLSRVFQQVTPQDFASRRSKSMQLLMEGLVPHGWKDMNTLRRSTSAIGVGMRVISKPFEIGLAVTGQRRMATISETLPRLGAYQVSKAKGMSDEQAQLAADSVTGLFSEKPLNATVHSVYRVAGFVNPAMQIFGQMTKKFVTDPVPARGAARAGIIGGNVALWTGALWAINRSITSDEQRASDAERTEIERLTHMNILGFRIPFDYGLIGAIQSYVWNKLDELDGLPGVSGIQVAKNALSEVFPHTSINPLELSPMTLKAGIEAKMNHSLYRDSSIETPWMQYIEPQERYFDSTPELYRWIGRAANASPVKIQYFVRNGLGIQLDETARLLDRIDEGMKLEELASIPYVGRMFSKDPVGWNSRSVRDAADIGREYDALNLRWKRLLEDPTADQEAVDAVGAMLRKLQPVKDAMLEVQRLYDESKDAAQGDPNRSRVLKSQMVDIARQGLIDMAEIEDEENR